MLGPTRTLEELNDHVDGVHRAGLQSSAAAFRAGVPLAGRVRTPADARDE